MTDHEITQQTAIQQAANWIDQADSLIIAAGAGMGVDSGLPDFRGPEGFWKAYPALGQLGMGFTQIANPQAFRDMPLVAWGFYGHRLQLYRHTQPHQGFNILLEWGGKMPNRYQVFTSNVDGQFQKAGFDLMRVHECHGSIHHLQCLEPCHDRVWSAHEFEPLVDEIHCRLRSALPRCPRCEQIARPAILMFDDLEWVYERTHKQHDYQERWLKTIRNPVVIEIGAGTRVPSVRHFTERIQHQFHAPLIRINPNDLLHQHNNLLVLPMKAKDCLLQLQSQLEKLDGKWKKE
jgi:NAD-dependent SIR2 family protein deacetylase